MNISRIVYGTEDSFCKRFLLIISDVLNVKIFLAIIGEDFEEVVGVFLPNFEATGNNTMLRRPFELSVFSTQKGYLG